MAPIGGPTGGGQAGFGSGGSFTGAAEALEIYGDFAGANSGAIQVSNSLVTHLNFTSGNYLFVGELTFNGANNVSAVTGGAIGVAEISFNGVVIMKVKAATDQEDMPGSVTIPILIPSYTEVKVQVQTDSTGAGTTTDVNLVGRIYRE